MGLGWGEGFGVDGAAVGLTWNAKRPLPSEAMIVREGLELFEGSRGTARICLCICAVSPPLRGLWRDKHVGDF